MSKTIKLIGACFTLYGAGWFAIGIFTGDLQAMQVGLLAQILGELVDMPKN